jgi:hypothetical protein
MKRRAKSFHHEHSQTLTNGREKRKGESGAVGEVFGRVSGSSRKPRRGCGCVPDTSACVPDTSAMKRRAKSFHHEHSQTLTNGREERKEESGAVGEVFGRVSGSIRKPRRGCGCVPDTSALVPDTSAMKRKRKSFHHEHSRTDTNGREEREDLTRRARRRGGRVPDTSSILGEANGEHGEASGEHGKAGG